MREFYIKIDYLSFKLGIKIIAPPLSHQNKRRYLRLFQLSQIPTLAHTVNYVENNSDIARLAISVGVSVGDNFVVKSTSSSLSKGVSVYQLKDNFVVSQPDHHVEFPTAHPPEFFHGDMVIVEEHCGNLAYQEFRAYVVESVVEFIVVTCNGADMDSVVFGNDECLWVERSSGEKIDIGAKVRKVAGHVARLLSDNGMYGGKHMVRVDIGFREGGPFVNEVQQWYGAGLFFHLDVTNRMKNIHARWFKSMIRDNTLPGNFSI